MTLLSRSGRTGASSSTGTTRNKFLRKMRGYFFFRPLIVILAFLMLPPEFGNFNFLVPKADAFSPNPVPQNCLQTGGSWVIQLVCQGPSTNGAPPSSLVTAVEAYETDSLKQYLNTNNLPNTDSDVAFFYQYARTDLRNSLRAFMELRMINIDYKQPGDRTAIESAALSWFSERLWQHEKDMYQSAVNDRNLWQSNRCTWPIDQDIAKAYGILYLACGGLTATNNAPNEAYFLAAAKKRTYDNILAGAAGTWTAGPTPASLAPGTPVPPPVYAEFVLTGTELGAVIGAVAACVGIIGTAIGVAQIPSVATKITPFQLTAEARAKLTNRFAKKDVLESPKTNKASPEDTQDEVIDNTTKAANEAETEADIPVEGEIAPQTATDTVTPVVETAVEGGSDEVIEGAAEAGLLAAGPIGIIIGVGVLLAVVVITLIVSEAQAEATLSDLDTLNNNIKANAPDVLTYASDDIGKYKLQVLWAEATFPDLHSTAALPSPGANDYILYKTLQGDTTSTPASGLLIPDWAYTNWTPTLYGGWFIRSGTSQVPAGIPVSGSQTLNYSTISPYIRYWGWDGYEYSARRLGTNFVITEGQLGNSDVPCPANGISGVTPPRDFSTCSAYVASSVQVTDVNGDNYTIFPAKAPAFSVFANTTELSTLTNLLTIPVFATGLPTPTITVDPSTPLPPGFTLQPGNNPLTDGNAYFSFTGANAQTGNFTVKLNATNAAGSAQSTYTFPVGGPDLNQRILFLNPYPNSQVSWVSGVPIQPLNWRVSAGGAVNFTYVGEPLPPGITLTDHGDGTATMSGTPTVASPPSCGGGSCGIQACYGTTTGVCTTVPFGYAITQPPAPVLDDHSWSFHDGVFTSYTLTTHPLATTPITFSLPCGDFPFDWATLTDNGDGTASLSGTAPNGAGGPGNFHLQIVTQGITPQSTFTFCAAPASQSLVYDPTPLITSANTATFTVGQLGGLAVTSNVSGATIVQNSALPLGLSLQGNGLLSGTPVPGSGGSYPVSVIATDFVHAPAIGTVTVTVLEPPSLTLPPVIYFMPGVTNSFAVTPGGYPAIGGMSVALTGAVPSGVYYSDVAITNSQQGYGSIHGNPVAAASGVNYPLSFLATNSQGTATASTILNILHAGDVTHDGVVDCKDYSLVKASLNAKAGAANYNAVADINGDGVVNVLDLAFITAHLPAGTKCQ